MFPDALITAFDRTLRVISGVSAAHRPNPALSIAATSLSDAERRHSAGLMRVNHVGEVCAQALYEAQSRFAKAAVTRQQFVEAGKEEMDHLAWTAQRLEELGARPSLLNPLWYAGAFGLGLIAGRLGDAVSLGFVVETERQVGAHLQSHLESLPAGDHASRAIVVQMRDDELRHAQDAQQSGAVELPQQVKDLMRSAAKVMTTLAHRI